MKIHKYVGLHVHQDETVVAVAGGVRFGEVRLCAHRTGRYRNYAVARWRIV